ncbi:MAG: protein kinase [Gemmatimonadota bacterium]|nr:protein kinase [Gemmatimonadota bacterium]
MGSEDLPVNAERIPPLLLLAAQFEVVRELGRGGTAVVYLARERATDREVAIKLIHARFAEDAEAVARFAREARFVAQLDHPNIVRVDTVLDLGDGGIALVMAYVPGRTLKQLILEDGPLPAAYAERVLRDVAGALGAAHARGIVHRDVKPENIFIDGDGRALLADFGVARSMSGETQQLTMHGVAIGTPTYMAPEQIDGGELDGRGDIYSLGLAGWEMLSGRRPWDGEALYSVLYHQKHVPLPDVRALRSDVPPHLAIAIEGATEKEREARWQSADELLAALDGNAPARRTPTVVPVSTETVRVIRPVAAPAAAELPAPSAAAATASLLSRAVGRAHPSRSVVVAGALVALMALIFLARGVQAWSDGAARRRQVAETRTASAIRAVSAGAVAPHGAVSVPGASVFADTVVISTDSRIGVAVGGPLSAMTLGSGKQPSLAGLTTPAASAMPSGLTAHTRDPVPSPASVTAAAAPGPAAIASDARTGAGTRIRIVAGGRHTCLIASDGRGYCWGGNDHGQLGTGATDRMAIPAPIATDQRFTAVAPGLSHSCALDVGGAAWCWGDNDRGQLGDRSTTARVSPVRVVNEHVFRSIAAGASHSCGLDTAAFVWCWGANGLGQLGDGETADQSAPVAAAGGRHFTSLVAGWNFTCALDADRHALCWGDDGASQLGDGHATGRRTSVGVPGGGRLAFSAISAGSAHACGLIAGGDSYCWGDNSGGQLGDGSTTNRAMPVRVDSDLRFVAITAGAVHSCALTGEGEAFCWGRNTYGQLGDGGTDDHATPVRVVGGHAFTTIRAFGSHTCAATASEEAFCWGYNLDGQLGDGTRTHRTRPTYVERAGGR